MNVESLAFYHAPCADGIFAAHALRMCQRDKVAFVPYEHQKVPDLIFCKKEYPRAEKLFFLDCAGPNAGYIFDALKLFKHGVTVIDHHKTALEFLSAVKDERFKFVYDVNKSGCRLAWEEFFRGNEMPEIFEYVEDNDLYRFKLPRSKEFTAGLFARNLPLVASPLECFVLIENISIEECIESGVEVLAKKTQAIAEIVENKAFSVVFPSMPHVTCWCAECDEPSYISDLGDALARSHGTGLGAIFRFKEETKLWSVSLRSVGEIDTTVIAKSYGGGGHKNASGCSIENHTWAQLIGASQLL